MSSVAAVLTGDLVGSTRAGPTAVEAAMAALGAGAQVVAGWTGADTRFTRFRGDGWQIYLEDPGLAFRACLYLTACLRAGDAGLATRIAAGIGAVAELPAGRLDSAGGAAFELSGHALDTMPRGRRLVLAAPALPGEAAGVFALADALSRHWTAKQAEALTLALAPGAPSQSEMAAKLGITQQAFAIRLNGAGLWGLDESLRLFEARSYA
jgi:hypothetical protein